MAEETRSARSDLSALRINRDPEAPGGTPWFRIFIVLAILGGGGYFAYRHFNGPGTTPEIETGLVRRVGANEGSALLSASGYILPDRKADVGARSFGRLESIDFKIGDKVKEGFILARLANADIAAQVEEAKAAVADAEREYARFKDLVAKGSSAKQELDKADTTVQLTKARLKQIEASFEYTLIRAPFDGVIVKKNANVGESVGPSGGSGTGSTGGTVCTIVDRASLEMVADVNETNISKIRVGQPAEVIADALPDKKYAGEVRQIVPTADRQKGTVQVKIKIVNLDDAIFPEMAARATFLREGAVAVGVKKTIAPRSSVKDREGRKVVFVLEGEQVRRVEVETGLEGEDGFEILKGLLGGERVVTGGDSVEDGMKVRIKPAK